MSRREPATETEIAYRLINAIRLTRAVRTDLLHDQRQLVSPGSTGDGVHTSGGTTSDPTATLATSESLAPYAATERRICDAWVNIDRTVTQLMRTLDAELKRGKRAPVVDAEPRCPGWNTELQEKLGGCGNVLEHYRRADGGSQPRSTMLCVGCRKAKERDEREQSEAA